MCGIGGIMHLDGAPVERFRLKAMADAMEHRGPDGEGVWTDGPIGLAHRRLAIIDLSTGDQPLFNEDGSVVTVFNGEIYNFLDLKPQLEARGHVFRSRSDTEVLVHGWEEWGTRSLERLNGMYAYAVYDRSKRRLLLACDRLGVKPLYYYRGKNVLVFASEMGALLASGLVPREIDREALELYLHYQYVPAPLSIYRGVRKLSPASWMTVDADGSSEGPAEYWRLPLEQGPDRSVSFDQWKERLASLLEDAVRIRLISDVPFGAFLSGGTDSGVVVALMARQLANPVRTFSIGLDEVERDELPRAREIATRYRTEHHEHRVSAEAISLIPRLCRHFGEPFADSSAVPTFHVARLAREQVKMVLTGDGGDEMFGGYRTYPALAGTVPVGLPNARRMAPIQTAFGLRSWSRLLLHKARRMAVVAKRAAFRQSPAAPAPWNMPWHDLYDRWMSHFIESERRALLGEGPLLSSTDHFSSQFRLAGADSVVAAAQYCDLKSYLPGDILTKVDRMSMANSLEVRSPLLDYRMAELGFSMPTEVKLADLNPDGRGGKYVLKEVATPHLGRDYVYAPKSGFGIPVARWLREDRTGAVKEALLSASGPLFDLLDKRAVQSFARAHLDGVEDHSSRVWNLLMLDGWLRWVHREPAAAERTATAQGPERP